MTTKLIKLTVLLVLAAVTLGVSTVHAESSGDDAIEKWQQLSETERALLSQRFQRWETLKRRR